MKLDSGSTQDQDERQRASSPMSGSGHTRASDVPTGSPFEADAPTATATGSTPQPMLWTANGEVKKLPGIFGALPACNGQGHAGAI